MYLSHSRVIVVIWKKIQLHVFTTQSRDCRNMKKKINYMYLPHSRVIVAVYINFQIISPVFSFLVDNAESKQIQFYTLKALLHGKASIAILVSCNFLYHDPCQFTH